MHQNAFDWKLLTYFYINSKNHLLLRKVKSVKCNFRIKKTYQLRGAPSSNEISRCSEFSWQMFVKLRHVMYLFNWGLRSPVCKTLSWIL